MTYRFVSETALRFVQLALLVEAIVRGINYIITPTEASSVYNQLIESAPMWVWGVGFIFFGTAGLFGEALLAGNVEPPTVMRNPRAYPSFFAHSALMILFIALALSAIAGVADRDPFYGFHVPYDMLAFAGLHWMFARRRKNAG